MQMQPTVERRFYMAEGGEERKNSHAAIFAFIDIVALLAFIAIVALLALIAIVALIDEYLLTLTSHQFLKRLRRSLDKLMRTKAGQGRM